MNKYINADEQECIMLKNEMIETNDWVEVVRCKDCRYYLGSEIYPDMGLWCHKFADGLDMPPDGYCSYGERKETDDSKRKDT